MKFTEKKLERADIMINAKLLMVNETAISRFNN
jgi:hypothetical protein